VLLQQLKDATFVRLRTNGMVSGSSTFICSTASAGAVQ
jgi:hypothetical protein